MKEHQYVTEALEEMKQLAAKAESHRRERASMPTTPMPGMVDYASAGVALDNGWQHMNESIVNGQKQRTEAAAELVALGLYHTLLWLKATGYKVPTLWWDETNELTVEAHNAEVSQSMRRAAMERAGEVPTYDPLADPAADGYTKVPAPVRINTEPEDIEARLHNFAILATDAIALLTNELKARYNSVKHPELDATLEAIKELKL